MANTNLSNAKSAKNDEFYTQNFERFGLKKLISTSYAAESKKTKGIWQPSLFETESPKFDKKKTKVRGKIFVLDHDTNQNGRIDHEDLEWEYLKGDGDFRSSQETFGIICIWLRLREGFCWLGLPWLRLRLARRSMQRPCLCPIFPIQKLRRMCVLM